MSPEQQEINVTIAQEALKALYTDMVFLNSDPFGFVLNFGQKLPQPGQVQVFARIAFSPQHAKVLANLLADNIKRYEKEFGEIKVTEKMQKDAKDKSIGFSG
ncbi:MAG: DUF3467 domain-containing protein [bacterium]